MNDHKLFIHFFDKHLEHCCWSVIDGQGQVIREAAQAVFAEIPQEWRGLPSWVIVPGEYLIIKKVTLPKSQRIPNPKVLAYALEDDLLSDAENLKITVLSTLDTNAHYVAALETSLYTTWQSLLQGDLPNLQTVVPCMLSLPWQASQWTIAEEINDTVSIRTELYQGYSVDKHNLKEMLQALMVEYKTTPAMVFHCVNESNALTEELNISHQPMLNLQMRALVLLQQPAISLIPRKNSNLLKSIQLNIFKLNSIWRKTVFVLLTWFSIMGCLYSYEFIQLSRNQQILQQHIQTAYSQLSLQNEASTQQQVLQLEHRLRGKYLKAKKFFSVLDELGQIVFTLHGKVQTLSYQQHAWTVNLLLTDKTQVTTLLEYLQKKQLEVRVLQSQAFQDKWEVQLWIAGKD